MQIAYPLILLARENRGQLSYSLSIHQSNLFSHFSVYSARPCNRWRCCLTPSCTTNSSPMGKREKLACFRAMLASCPIASSPSNRHSCFCFGAKPARYCAKQPVIIAICQAGPAASIQKSSSFRAYYELIMSLLWAYYKNSSTYPAGFFVFGVDSFRITDMITPPSFCWDTRVKR